MFSKFPESSCHYQDIQSSQTSTGSQTNFRTVREIINRRQSSGSNRKVRQAPECGSGRHTQCSVNRTLRVSSRTRFEGLPNSSVAPGTRRVASRTTLGGLPNSSVAHRLPEPHLCGFPHSRVAPLTDLEICRILWLLTDFPNHIRVASRTTIVLLPTDLQIFHLSSLNICGAP